jgi:hypothetical protein
MMNIEEAVKNLAECTIMLMKEHYNEPKMIRMMDGLGKLIFKELQNTDIVDNPEVFIEAGSLFRNEALDRDAKILQLSLLKKVLTLKSLELMILVCSKKCLVVI